MHLPHPRIPPLSDAQLSLEEHEALRPRLLSQHAAAQHFPHARARALTPLLFLAEKGPGDEGRTIACAV